MTEEVLPVCVYILVDKSKLPLTKTIVISVFVLCCVVH